VTEIHKSPLLLTPTHGIMYLSKDDAGFIYDNPDIVPFNAGQFMFLNSSRMKEHFSNIRWLKSAWPDEYFYEQSFMNYYFVFRSLTRLMNMTFKKKINVSELSLTDGILIETEKEISTDDQLIRITFNINKKPSDDEAQLLDFIRMKKLANNKKIMTVSGATNSNFSRSSTEKFIAMPEGILTEPSLMHSENTVAIHFAATLSDGLDKKTFMNLYANAHKLHI
jgi:hypothetical protein